MQPKKENLWDTLGGKDASEESIKSIESSESTTLSNDPLPSCGQTPGSSTGGTSRRRKSSE